MDSSYIFLILNIQGKGPRNKCSVIGIASLNLAEFASAAEEKEMEINVTLLPPGVTTESHPVLYVC